MLRGYTRKEYLGKAEDLKNARPDIQITGDMIVGFPGETEEDFALTLSLMEEVQYADLFSFVFSERPETEAAGYTDKIPLEEMRNRLDKLQSFQKKITLDRNRSYIGSIQRILVEGKSKQADQLFGRTCGNRIVNFTGDQSLVGEFVSVRISRAFQNSLLGELLQDNE